MIFKKTIVVILCSAFTTMTALPSEGLVDHQNKLLSFIEELVVTSKDHTRYHEMDDGHAILDEKIISNVKKALHERGFSVRQIKMEDGFYEVYAYKNLNLYEILLDKEYVILRIKRE